MCFNGAAFSRTRKCGSRGNGDAMNDRLQWGRVLANAEITLMAPIQKMRSRLQWGRVLANAEIIALSTPTPSVGRASMGPRSRERGNVSAVSPYPTGYALLQWGRVLANAEITFLVAGYDTYCRSLQWGRVLANAEITIRVRGSRIWSSFNGAAFSRTRK